MLKNNDAFPSVQVLKAYKEADPETRLRETLYYAASQEYRYIICDNPLIIDWALEHEDDLKAKGYTLYHTYYERFRRLIISWE